MTIRRVAAALGLAGTLTAALVAGVAPVVHAGPALDRAQLERLRDTVAAAAPVGSATHIDPRTGTIEVRVPGRRPAGVAAAAGQHAGLVRVVEHAGSAATMANLYSGVRMETAFQERFCSTGLYATGGGWLWMLTAGHCVKDGHANTSVWYTAGGYTSGGLIGVGTILTPSFPGDDYGAIQISRISPYQPQSFALTSTGPVPIHSNTTPPIGAVVCKTGQTTGTTCGQVTATGVTVTYHEGVVHGLIASTVCVASGDSGAPLYHRDLQYVRVLGLRLWLRHGYGVISGGSLFGCDNPSYRSYAQPVGEILSAYGLSWTGAPVQL